MTASDDLLLPALELVNDNQHMEATDLILEHLQKFPKSAKAHTLLGVIMLKLADFGRAEQLLKMSLDLDENQQDAAVNLGVVLKKLGRSKEAKSILELALALDPEDTAALHNYANVLRDTGDFKGAEDTLKRSLKISPKNAANYEALGHLAREAGLTRLAIQHYECALRLDPSDVTAAVGVAQLWLATGEYSKARDLLAKFAVTNPDNRGVISHLWEAYALLANWSKLPELIERALLTLDHDQALTDPFRMLVMRDDAALQLKSAAIWADFNYRHLTRQRLPASPKSKLKIGYFSGDFRNHPSMHLMIDIFEKHDRERFEILAFSMGPESRDEWAERAKGAFDQFFEIRTMSNEDAIQLARSKNLDIAVDAMIYTSHNRAELFANGLAPVHTNFLAYPGTSGAGFHDYIIADPVLIPETSRQFFCEKVAYMPHSYQANCKERDIGNPMKRAEYGLPLKGFVFCSFNQVHKLNAEVFALWVKIISSCPNSILWLWADAPETRENILREAEKLGLDPTRIIFAGKLPVADHLARLLHADLFLDTRPYNAHTTASDALRMGLPVLTRIGEAFASRVAASLLNAVGMNELITYSDEEYVAKAIELGSNPEKLKAIKDKLKANLPTAPLFDSERYTRDLERLYLEMHRRAVAGEAPDHIILD